LLPEGPTANLYRPRQFEVPVVEGLVGVSLVGDLRKVDLPFGAGQRPLRKRRDRLDLQSVLGDLAHHPVVLPHVGLGEAERVVLREGPEHRLSEDVPLGVHLAVPRDPHEEGVGVGADLTVHVVPV